MSTNQKRNAIEHWYSLGQRRCYCGVQLVWNQDQKNSATFEHLVPKSQGGTLALKNSLVICSDCNNNRGNADWIDWIVENNPPKAKWLLHKYNEAVQYYSQHNRKLKVKHGNQVHIHIEQLTINM